MIKVNNLSVAYGKGMPNIIENMTFSLDEGCVLNILGQNAVGKTTLIKTLMRELQGYRGSIQINGKEIKEYSIREFAQLIGVVSTTFHTSQNLLVADYLVTGYINQMSPFSKPDSRYINQAYMVLEHFGKEELFNRPIEQLSSGERQIVMIARVLLQNPKIIIVDEPTANLDVKNQIIVLNQIKKLTKQGYTVIVTTHNPGHAYSIGGKILLMGKRRYVLGNIDEVLTSKNLSDYYGLKVTMRDVEDFKCMTFENDKDDGVKIIF